MTLMRILLSMLVCSMLLVWSATSRAASVRYLSDASETFNRRVVAEIESVGLEVERPASETDALPIDCVALIRVRESTGDVEVWLNTGTTLALATTVKRDAAATEDQDSVRIAESVRGILAPLAERREPEASGPLPPPPPPRETSTKSGEPPPTPTPMPPTRAPSRSTAWNWESGALVALVSQPGGVGVSAGLALRRRLWQSLWADLSLALPLTATTLEQSDASAEVQTRLGNAGLSWDFRPASDVSLRAGAGASVAWVVTRGDAVAPRRGVTDSATMVLPHLSLQSGLDVTQALAVELGLLGAWSVTQTDIAFGSEVVATFGQPLLLLHLGVVLKP